MNNRVFWIDAVKAVSMIFVVVNHSWANTLWLENFYIPFFLTLFFFVSGYVFVRSNQHFSLKYKLIRITESLVIPYFSYWIVSYFILDVIVMKMGINGYFQHLIWSFQDGNKLWFISCLLLIELIMTFIFALSNKVQIQLLISIMILGCYFCFPTFHQEHSRWSINVALFMQVFFMLGHIYKVFENRVNTLCRNYYVPYIAIIVYLFIYLYSLVLGISIGNIASNRYSSYWLFMLMAIMGIIAMVSGLKRIKSNFVISYIGTNTLLIYFFHKQLLDLSNNILIHLYHYTPTLGIGILQVLFVFIVVTIPIYICNHYLCFISGKSRWLSNIFQKNK